MPAWHLITADGQGITLINIGVGPSNAKTICDHLAVLRPDVWLMIGHCGGLRESQLIGDYVLAHAYLRDDHVLDAVLPPDIPIPSIADSARCMTPPKRSAACRAKRLNSACAPVRSSPPMTATGSCVTPPPRCGST
jgi:nucleoside phosphorylase